MAKRKVYNPAQEVPYDLEQERTTNASTGGSIGGGGDHGNNDTDI